MLILQLHVGTAHLFCLVSSACYQSTYTGNNIIHIQDMWLFVSPFHTDIFFLFITTQCHHLSAGTCSFHLALLCVWCEFLVTVFFFLSHTCIGVLILGSLGS